MKSYHFITKEITNKDYFFMIDNQIRATMPKFEIGVCLPKLEKLLKDCGISSDELLDYPIEGYYYKSEALKKYFTLIRNLQHNTKIFGRIKDCAELQFLQNLTSSPVFGESRHNTSTGWKVWEQTSRGTAFTFTPRKAPYTEQNPPLIRLYDILSLTMQDTDIFDAYSTRPWTIEKIKSNLSKYYKARPNLVELAYLTGETECLLCGAETNSLYRMFAMISGCMMKEEQYIWMVSPEVEELGAKVIEAYNKLIGSSMLTPDIFNHTSLNSQSNKPKVATLGKILATNEWYFWTMNGFGDIEEKYTREFLTTEKMASQDSPTSKDMTVFKF